MGFDYDPLARAERFEQFLREVWPGDERAQQGLLELFGLLLTDVTKFQKWWMFVGPPRGGRGTIGRVTKGLLGAENFVGSSLKDLSDNFGMEDYVGKKLVLFSDAKLDGLNLKALTAIAERFQQSTGEDDVGINRKYAKYWRGPLTARFIVFSNEVLEFRDETGALAERCMTFRMQEQFLGQRADPNLTDKLLAERSGILNLALDALDRLWARGSLIQPASGIELG